LGKGLPLKVLRMMQSFFSGSGSTAVLPYQDPPKLRRFSRHPEPIVGCGKGVFLAGLDRLIEGFRIGFQDDKQAGPANNTSWTIVSYPSNKG